MRTLYPLAASRHVGWLYQPTAPANLGALLMAEPAVPKVQPVDTMARRLARLDERTRWVKPRAEKHHHRSVYASLPEPGLWESMGLVLLRWFPCLYHSCPLPVLPAGAYESAKID